MSIPKRTSDQSSIHTGLRTFFVSTNTDGKRPLFQVEQNARLLIDTLYQYRSQKKYLLHEFVVMKNHLHVLLTINEELSIERALQFIKGGYSFRLKKEMGKSYEVWQRGFSETRIYDSVSFEKHRQYIHENPVKAGYVEEAAQFPFSSAHPGFDLDASPFTSGAKALFKVAAVGTPEGVP